MFTGCIERHLSQHFETERHFGFTSHTHFGFTHFSLRIRQMFIEPRDFSDSHTCGRLRDTSVRETENDAQSEFIETDFH